MTTTTEAVTIYPTLVQKRTGELVDFNINKIYVAIQKAHAPLIFTDQELEHLYSLVSMRLIIEQEITVPVHIETIQNCIEKSLMVDFPDTAKAYILYRQHRTDLRDHKVKKMIDSIDSYLDRGNWEVKENSNMAFSLQGLHNYIANNESKVYWLNKVYPEYISNAHTTGSLHLHDLGFLSTYCVGWDLKDILIRGFNGVPDKIATKPPKHFDTVLGQITNFIYTLTGEAAGAQAINNVDTLLAPFIRHDQLTYKQVVFQVRKWLFNMNVPTRVGFQCPFSNVSMDLICPKWLKGDAVILGGVPQDTTYGEYQVEMDMFNEAFAEVMLEGDAAGRAFPFPIPTYSIGKDFNWSNPAYDKLWRMTGKTGNSYFCNYINSDLNPEDARSMCPLHPTTELTILTSNGISQYTMNQLYGLYNYNSDHEVVAVKRGLQWAPIQDVVACDSVGLYTVWLEDGRSIAMDRKHLQLVMTPHFVCKNVEGGDITSDMLIPCSYPIGVHNYRYSLLHKAYFAKIDKIVYDPSYKGKTYCLVLDTEDHLFDLSNGIVTHNCRLKLDLTQLRKRGGGLFGSGSLTGSCGVTSINLPRIGYLAKSEEEFFSMLRNLMDIAKESLILKREFLEVQTERGFYPYTKYYLSDTKLRTGAYWTNHFSTIGLLGMHEACLNFLGVGIETEEGHDFAYTVLQYMKAVLVSYQLETDTPFNLEASPGEGVTYRFFNLDRERYTMTKLNPDIHYYTNSTQLPVDATSDMFEALDHQSDLQEIYTGGTVFHGFIPEEITDIEAVKKLVKTVLSKYQIPYFSITPTYSTCPTHGYLAGEHFTCNHPGCDRDCEVYTRVVGYFSAVSRWNDAKSQEYTHRKLYEIPAELDSVESDGVTCSDPVSDMLTPYRYWDTSDL